MKLDKITKFDWRSLQKYTSPQAINDFNSFLEKMPQNTNKTLLIIAASVWAFAAVVGLYATVKMQEFSEVSLAREEAQALVPNVPVIKDKAVEAKMVAEFVDEMRKIYKGLEIQGNSANITIRAKSTAQYGEFREAIGHVQNGGSGWRVNVERLCVGKECLQYPLAAALKINQISVD